MKNLAAGLAGELKSSRCGECARFCGSNGPIHACPGGREKITSWIDDARIKSLNVLIMQVSCCTGLLNLALQTVEKAERKLPLVYTVVGVQRDILEQKSIQ